MLQSLNLSILVLICGIVDAQNETSKWYFGSKVGLDFMTSPPSVLNNSSMNLSSGVVSLADSAGNLLFYSSGDTVWNRLHQPMANGTGLFGHKASQHVAVPLPGSITKYYLFTNDFHNLLIQKKGLNYSVIDMALAGGTGSVTVKNVQLISDALRFVAAVLHCNGQDIWVVAHEAQNDVFRSYLLTPSGLNSVAVISATGPLTYTSSTHDPGPETGPLKASPTGQRLTVSMVKHNSSNWFTLFNFDNATGIVSQYRKLPGNSKINAYNLACEFSPDGSKLYGISNSYLYQWDLCGTDSAMLASKDSLLLADSNYVDAMQIAMNGKIYRVNGSTQAQSLDVLNNPNASLSNINFSVQAVYVGKTLGFMPNFMSSYFRSPLPAFSSTASCGMVSFSSPPPLCPAQSRSVTGRQWFFGDPASGGANTSTLSGPSHQYMAPGAYTVDLVLQYGCGSDTIRQVVNVTSIPAITVSGDQTVCIGESRTFTASGANSFTWNGVSSGSTAGFTPSATVVYTVSGTGSSGCIGSRVFTVQVDPCLGLGYHEGDVRARVFPNPGSGIYQLWVSENGICEVIDAGGRLIEAVQVGMGMNALDLRRVADGLYFFKFSTGSGSLVLKVQQNSD